MDLITAISILDGVFSNESTVVPSVLDAWKVARARLNAPKIGKTARWSEVIKKMGVGGYIDLSISDAYSLYSYIKVRGGNSHTSHKGAPEGHLRLFYLQAMTR